MADEPSPSEFLISKMEGMDDVTQVLIVTRTGTARLVMTAADRLPRIRWG
jgi:hypothetical protein